MSFCADGLKMQVRMKSFASRAQLAVTQAEIDAAMELEWDRRLITVLGSANNRLYEFRLQTANSTFETSKVCQSLCNAYLCLLHIHDLMLAVVVQEPLLAMARSFTCFTVDA